MSKAATTSTPFVFQAANEMSTDESACTGDCNALLLKVHAHVVLRCEAGRRTSPSSIDGIDAYATSFARVQPESKGNNEACCEMIHMDGAVPAERG